MIITPKNLPNTIPRNFPSVYLYLDVEKGEVLYIGKSVDTLARVSSHRRKDPLLVERMNKSALCKIVYFTLLDCEMLTGWFSKYALLSLETFLIRKIRPKLNKRVSTFDYEHRNTLTIEKNLSIKMENGRPISSALLDL